MYAACMYVSHKAKHSSNSSTVYITCIPASRSSKSCTPFWMEYILEVTIRKEANEETNKDHHNANHTTQDLRGSLKLEVHPRIRSITLCSKAGRKESKVRVRV